MIMKFNIKFIAVILVLLMLIPQTVLSASDDKNDMNEFNDSVELLNSLSLIEKSNFVNPSDFVKRNDFVKIILKFLGYEEFVSAETDELFSDVDADHPDAEYIYAAKQLGILNGYSDGNFYPEATLMSDQLIKVLCSALGYGIVAKNKGGYPAGYLKTASDNGILKGVSLQKNVTYGELIHILKNTLEVKVLNSDGISSKGNISFSSSEVFREAYHDIYKLSGVVTATKDNAEFEYKNTSENLILIGNTAFNIEAIPNACDLFGYNVTAYYKKDKADCYYALIYAKPDNSNNTVTISAEKILSSDNYIFKYTDDKKDSCKSIDYKGTTVLYNGKIAYSYSSADLMPEVGEVEFLDNNCDGRYEYAFVFSASQNILLSRAVLEKDKIYLYDKITTTSALTLEEEKSKQNYSVSINSKSTDIFALSEDDLILVGVSKNKDYYVLKASHASVKGCISSFSDDEITVDNEKYPLTKNYCLNVGTNNYYEKLIPGIMVQIYLNCYGEVSLIYETKDEDNLKYGFILELENISSHNEMRSWHIKILSEESVVKVFELPEKLKYNGENKNSQKVITELYSGDGIYDPNKKESIALRQLIRYRLDDTETYIKEICTNAYEDKLKYNGSFTQKKDYDYYLSCWGRQYYKNNNTKIFHIYEEEDYCTVDSVYEQWQPNPAATCHFYNIDDTLTVGAVVRYYAGSGSHENGTVEENRGVVIAEKAVMGLDYAENSSKAITSRTLDGNRIMIMPGEFTNDFVINKFNEIYDSLHSGDILVYDVDSSGSLKALERVVDVSKPDYFGSNGAVSTTNHEIAVPQSEAGQKYFQYYDTTRWNIFGKVVKVVDPYIIYDVNSKLTREPARGVPMALVEVGDNNAEIEYNYDFNKVRSDDRIFAWGVYGRTKEIIIMRFI